MSSPSPPDVTQDTASILLNHAPYVPTNDSKTESRLDVICAYRHYLETLYHESLDLSEHIFAKLMNLLDDVVRIADAYGSLSTFQMPIRLAFEPFRSALSKSCDKNYLRLLFIAMKIRFAWLFKLVICRWVGDPAWTDDRISKVLKDSEVISLILKKREQLRQRLLELDHKMMLIEPTEKTFEALDSEAIAVGVGAWRAYLVTHINEHNAGKRKSYARKYWALERFWAHWREHEYERLTRPYRNFHFDEDALEYVIAWFRTQVRQIIEPILHSNVEKDPQLASSNFHSSKYLDQGLTCVDITDGDLPWKNISW